MTLSPYEQAQVGAARHDGEGWAIAADADPAVLQQLAERGLMRHRNGRWQLTPAGFARSARFNRAAG